MIVKLGRIYKVKDPVTQKWVTMLALKRTPRYSCPAPSEPGTLFMNVDDTEDRVIVPRNFYNTSVKEED